MRSFKSFVITSASVATLLYGGAFLLDDVLKMYKNNTLEKNPTAIESLIVEAKNGNVDAMYLLATTYKNGKLGFTDLAKAKQWYKKAADLGDGDAMLMLGWIHYKQGDLNSQSIYRAKFWFKKAASLGIDEAIEMLSIMEK